MLGVMQGIGRWMSLASAVALAVACGDDGPSGSAGSGGAGGAAGDAGTSGGSAGADSGTGGDAGLPPGFQLAPSAEQTFTSSNANFPNPERGFYRYANVVGATNLSSVSSGGHTLAYSYVRLDDYRDSSLPASLLTSLSSGLAAARSARIKVILRFAYNFGPYPNSEPDAPKSRILEHIDQVAPTLAANEDVLAIVQAGFIGAWGEWHTSTNDLLADPADRKDILEALLDAIPASRTTALRYPLYKQEMYGAPLSESAAFLPSYAARTGHHNDCFLSSNTDVGTYPSSQIEALKTYLEQETRYVPMGGETCALHERSECTTAIAEMERLHYSYLNLDYEPSVIQRWKDDGCFDEIDRRMGYRLALVSAKLAPKARPGGAFELEVALANSGFAAPFNPRPVQLVLSGAGTTWRATLSAVEVRAWLPGAPIALSKRVVQLPSDLPPGQYELGLALPDAAPALAAHGEYAIRLANDGVWDATSGMNRLGTIEIAGDAPGDSLPGVTALEVTLSP